MKAPSNSVGHTAVMDAQQRMWVFGGCSPRVESNHRVLRRFSSVTCGEPPAVVICVSLDPSLDPFPKMHAKMDTLLLIQLIARKGQIESVI